MHTRGLTGNKGHKGSRVHLPILLAWPLVLLMRRVNVREREDEGCFLTCNVYLRV